MDDSSAEAAWEVEDSWTVYLDQLAERVGGVSELSRRSKVHRGTIHDYKAKPGSGKKVTVEIVVAIARGGGDDPVNAFRAAAGLGAEAEEDAEIAAVRALGYPERMTTELITDILTRRELDRQRRMRDTGEIIRDKGEIIRLSGEKAS